MTLKHQLKLVIPKIKWFFNAIHNGYMTLVLLRDKDNLQALRNEYHEDFIQMEKRDRSAPRLENLRGRVELLDELMEFYG